MSAADAVLDILFPPRCAFCGKLMDHTGDGVCPACAGALPYVEEDRVRRKVNGYTGAVAFYYDGPVREGVRGMKFGQKAWRARPFGRYVAQAAAEHLSGEFDAVTFVPVSAWRRFRRGFDQARRLAEAAAKAWDVPAEAVLQKVRNNPAQSTVKTPAERRANVRGVYRVRPGARVAGRRFLLIDDVLTTGSTMSACADTLMAAGAASVVFAVLAGGHQEGSDRKDTGDRELSASSGPDPDKNVAEKLW